MVATTSDDFDKLFDSIKKQYKFFVPAAGLFWSRNTGHGKEHGLRVESPAIAMEFVDKINFGTDPEGFLFFDSIKDFNPADAEFKTFYNVYYSTTSTKAKKAAVVQFFLNDDTSGPYYAQFLARDPNGVVDWTTSKSEGSWVTLKIGSASAHVKKYTDQDSIHVYIPSIEKKATFQVVKGSSSSTLDAIHGVRGIHAAWGEIPGGGNSGGWQPSVGGFSVRRGGGGGGLGGLGGGSRKRLPTDGDGGINPHSDDPDWPFGDNGGGSNTGTGGPVVPPDSGNKNDKMAVDVWGNIMFKKISSLTNPSGSSYADYNPGRILFYPQSGVSGSVDFTAVFFPLETADIHALGDVSFEANTVKWEDYKP